MQTKAGKDLEKRDLTLADSSGATVTCTLWGDKANGFYDAGDVVALKGVRVGACRGGSGGYCAHHGALRLVRWLPPTACVACACRRVMAAGEYGGRSLSTSFSSMIERNPDTDAGEH